MLDESVNNPLMATSTSTSTPRTLRERWSDWRRRQYSRVFTEHWRIGIIDAPLQSLLLPGPVPPIRWVTPRDNAGYWADPFGLSGSTTHVYCERFDEQSGLGRIELLELKDGELQFVEAVDVQEAKGVRSSIGRGLHASFPHTFELDGQRYALPETGASRDCVLYRVDDAGQWHSALTLLHGVAAADPALFRWRGLLWLAFTDVDIGTQDNLCLFVADRLQGPWRPHARNPVKIDLGGARMAGGFFEHEGVLYRPGMDCRGTYGAAVVIYRVEECSLRAYRETAIRVIEPDRNGPLPDGLHTLSAWGDRTLVDGKRMIFNPRVLMRKLVQRLRAGRQRRLAE